MFILPTGAFIHYRIPPFLPILSPCPSCAPIVDRQLSALMYCFSSNATGIENFIRVKYTAGIYQLIQLI